MAQNAWAAALHNFDFTPSLPPYRNAMFGNILLPVQVWILLDGETDVGIILMIHGSEKKKKSKSRAGAEESNYLFR